MREINFSVCEIIWIYPIYILYWCMDLRRKSKDLTGNKFPTYMGINFLSNHGAINLENNQMERITMSINVKASDYQKVLNNHLNSVSSALAIAGITDNKIVDKAVKQAESQFRTDYKATGGKHEDFFSSKCRLQLDKVNQEIRKLNALNPTGKTGVSVEVSTICKKA